MPLPDNAIPAALDHGLHLFQAHQFVEAEVVYTSILEQAPHPEALHMLGVLAYSRSRFEEACRFMAEADRLLPSPTEHQLCNYAIALAAMERHEEALAVFRRALALNPGLHRIHGRMGHVLLRLGRLAEAAAAVSQAIRIEPDYGDAYYFLGAILQAADRREEALVAFQEALRLMPESSTTCTLLGNALNLAGRKHEATRAYRAALAMVKAQEKAADPNRRASNAILRGLCAPLGGQILSIGSGSDSDKEGALYREYFPAGDAYYRLDFDKRHHPDLLADVQDLREVIPAGACDVVFAIWLLEHVPDPHAALSEIRRVLRAGGAFVFALPLNVDFHSFPHDYHRFTLDGLRQLFHGQFKLESVYPVGERRPLALDPRLSLIGTLADSAPHSYVGLCRAL